jgi:hypothetical protein
MADLSEVPLIMPTGVHGLRSTLDAAFSGPRLYRMSRRRSIRWRC